MAEAASRRLRSMISVIGAVMAAGLMAGTASRRLRSMISVGGAVMAPV
ncbi:MAG: hypothetical protein IJ126_01940 [Lachnospiraceae bacterium]|nr:hypothetical protein [Lachnospiraceae bacterium]